MVGNDVTENMIAETAGIEVFLLTNCMIKRKGVGISWYNREDFDMLLDFICGANKK